MDFLNSSDDYFYYGDTCQSSHKYGFKSSTETKKKEFQIPIYGGLAHIARVDTSKVKLHLCSYAAESPQIKTEFALEWGKKLKWIEDLLGLKHEEMASILNVSPSMIQKLIISQTKTPQASNQDRIKKFIDLVDFVSGKVKKRKFQVRALFCNPTVALGGISPIGYLKSSDDPLALLDVEGVMRRILE